MDMFSVNTPRLSITTSSASFGIFSTRLMMSDWMLSIFSKPSDIVWIVVYALSSYSFTILSWPES
jgi:hypothetical protein